MSISKHALQEIVGVIYIHPYTSREALRRVHKFLRRNARGRYRFGQLYRYPMIEFDKLEDLTGFRKKFARIIDAYQDLSDAPERPD